MTVPIGPAGVDECERNECMGCMWCELPDRSPCSNECPGWCISCDDATGIPAIEACDACWHGVNRAPSDDYYRRQTVCNVALAQALNEWLKRTAAPAHPEHAQCAAGCSCPSWPGGGVT